MLEYMNKQDGISKEDKMQLQYWGYFLLLIIAFITDVKSMTISNKVTVPAMVLGVLVHTLMDGRTGFWMSVQGGVIGFGIMFLMYLCGAVGGGDVKLFGAIGAWVGTYLTLTTMMYSIFVAGFIGVLILLWRKEALQRIRGVITSIVGAVVLKSIVPIQANAKGHLQFPFMLAVLPGAVIAFLYL